MSRTAIVIGAGIAGLACARALCMEGYSVTVFDRHDKAYGASVQNFGMFWPIGMEPSQKHFAKRSKEIWLDILSQEHLR